MPVILSPSLSLMQGRDYMWQCMFEDLLCLWMLMCGGGIYGCHVVAVVVVVMHDSSSSESLLLCA